DMRVRSADAERADTGKACACARRPWRCRTHDRARKVIPGNCRVELIAMQARRDRPVMQSERDLDEAGNAGGAFGVTDIGFDRADTGRLRFRTPFADHGGDGAEFDRIADTRTGAVRLEIADVADRAA